MNDGRFDDAGTGDARFDARARAAHAHALAALTPRVRAQLQRRRRAALAAAVAPRPFRRRHGWAWLGAPALALALAFGLPWRAAHEPPSPARVAASAVAGTVAPGSAASAALEQDPDFYLWLASPDALALASE